MRIPRLFTPQALSENTSLALNEEVSHYLKNVLRMKPERELILFNGHGGEYQAVLESVSKKTVVVRVGEYREVNTESPLKVELGVCLIKNDPMDWLIQKAVELGVGSLSPLMSEFTDVKLSSERMEKKQQHWQQVAIHAAEQCGRVQVPLLNPVQDIEAWLKAVNADKKYVLHPYQAEPIENSSHKTVQSIALLVGPEGGLSEKEVALARSQYYFEPVALGPRILRAETAPLAALSLFQSYYGDW